MSKRELTATSNSPGGKNVCHAIDQFKEDNAEGTSLSHSRAFGNSYLLFTRVIWPSSRLFTFRRLSFRCFKLLITHLIHGDIPPRNIILRLQNLSVLQEVEESNFTKPSALKSLRRLSPGTYDYGGRGTENIIAPHATHSDMDCRETSNSGRRFQLICNPLPCLRFNIAIAMPRYRRDLCSSVFP